MENFTAKASLAIHAPISKVWEALTKPEYVKQYLFGTDMHTDWKIGSPITYTGVWEGKEYIDKGTVLKFEPEKIIQTSYWSAGFGTEDKPENYKTVTYEVAPEGENTIVTVTQDNNDSQEKAQHSERNWNMVLEQMKELLEN